MKQVEGNKNKSYGSYKKNTTSSYTWTFQFGCQMVSIHNFLGSRGGTQTAGKKHIQSQHTGETETWKRYTLED